MKPTSEELCQLGRRDPVLGVAMRRVPPFPGFPMGELARGSHFQAIARSIAFQQLAAAAANTIYSRAKGSDCPIIVLAWAGADKEPIVS